MGNREYIPRLSVEIRDDQLAALQELLEHGERKKLFGIIVDDVIRLLRLDKAGFLMCVYARALKLEDFSIRIGDVSHGNLKKPAQVHSDDGGEGTPRSHFSSEASEAISSEEDSETFKDDYLDFDADDYEG